VNSLRKAKQTSVGIYIYSTEGNNILAESFTGVVDEATISIERSHKPKEVKAVAALKIRNQAMLIT
jgi:hypothetical protein